jgi:hypothetical protein
LFSLQHIIDNNGKYLKITPKGTGAPPERAALVRARREIAAPARNPSLSGPSGASAEIGQVVSGGAAQRDRPPPMHSGRPDCARQFNPPRWRAEWQPGRRATFAPPNLHRKWGLSLPPRCRRHLYAAPGRRLRRVAGMAAADCAPMTPARRFHEVDSSAVMRAARPLEATS